MQKNRIFVSFFSIFSYNPSPHLSIRPLHQTNRSITFDKHWAERITFRNIWLLLKGTFKWFHCNKGLSQSCVELRQDTSFILRMYVWPQHIFNTPQQRSSAMTSVIFLLLFTYQLWYTKNILKREGVLRKGNDASKKRGCDLLKNYK